MQRLFTYIFLPLTAGLMALTSLAQSGPGRFRFEHLTVNEGLAHSDAMCAEQDDAGFIWIGTNDGINRYDGYELKKYPLPLNTRNGLSSNRIRDLYIDPQNRLWAGAESAGLSLFDANHNQFVNIGQRADPTVDRVALERLRLADVEVIVSDKVGRIWVGTRAHGVFVLTLNSASRLTHIGQIALAGLADLGYGVPALATDRAGTVWIGTADRGLWSVRPFGTSAALPTAQAAPLSARAIRALHLDRRGDLWIGTDRQVLWVGQTDRTDRRTFSAHPLSQSVRGIECINLDSFGHLWVGTIFGLHMWEPWAGAGAGATTPVLTRKPTTFLPVDIDPFNINSGRIEQIFEDRNQILWLSASAGGLNKVNLRDKPFTTLQRRPTEHPTLTNNFVNAILKDESHNWLWIGTRNGFSRYDLTTKTYRNYENQQLPGDATGIDVSSFCRASDGTLWIGTRYAGLMTLKNETLTTYTTLAGSPSLTATSLESIVEDRYGTLWIASFELGLLHFDRQGHLLHRFHTGNSALPSNHFTFLLYNKENDILWASTRNAGVLKLRISATDVQVLKQFSYSARDSNSLSVNYAWPLLKDRRGQLWIGTIGGGLNQLTTNAQGQEVIRRFNRQLPLSDVESILEDESGQLWMGGAGLVRFNPATGQWLPYVVEDGLQSNSFKVGSAWRAADGTLYFGGIKGITYFQPRQIQPNPYAPVVHLTGLRIFNKPVLADEPINGHVILTNHIDQTTAITLQAADNDFSIDFVGLNYANPRKHTYAYRLIGYNDNWVIPAPGHRSASFANLPAGCYTFVVKAGNGEGRWSAKPVVLRITILPPWYRTWLAYLLYALALGGALIGYRRITLARQTLKNTLALEKFQAEKEKEMTDLKMRFFTNISHELRTPLTLILGPMEELASAKGTFHGFREKVSLMHQQTRKLLDLVNQLLEFRKVESGHVSLRASEGDIVCFLTEIFLIFRLKAEELQMDYALDAPGGPISMYFDRNKLEIILTNLLANALKYTPTGGKIRVLISVAGSPEKPAVFQNGTLLDNYLQVTVRDWGVGMKASETDRVFDSYYQASHTETMHIMGTGIGLSLVKQFVEAHSGGVTVQSEPGAGTAFSLRLPFGQAHLSPTDIVTESPAPELRFPSATESAETDVPGSMDTRLATAQTAAFGMPRLLVVEDNTELRQYLQQLFEPAFEVFVAADGVEGWEKTLSLLPTLVVSDVMMPRSDGLALCRQIKQHPKTAHIPVILLTARVAAVHELEGLETGADEYMAKPFDPKILYAKIATILQGRHQLKEYYQRQILLEPTGIVIEDADRLFLEGAMKIVETNINEPDFNVQALVREMGVSQSAFYRRIKSITGQSAVEFIRDVRLKRAAWLLSTTSLRVSEVAFQVGIDDLKYFRQMFHKVYGQSPSSYGKQQVPLEKIEHLEAL